jgi:protein transport protein HofC
VATRPDQPFENDERFGEPEPARSSSTALSDGSRELDAPQGGGSSRVEALRVRHLMYLVAAAAGAIWLGILLAGSVVILTFLVLGGIVMLFTAAMSACIIVARRRSTRQDALLSVLAIAAEKGMPLSPAVMAFADSYRGRSYRQIVDLADELSGGTPVAEALERANKVVTRDAALLARVGEAAGMLPKALRIASASRSSHVPIWTVIAARLAYILMLLLAMQVITGFIMYFIIPKFEAIFSSFGEPLPRVTILAIDASHLAVKYGYVTFLFPLLEVVLLIALPLSFLTWGSYSVPIFDHVLGRRHTALVLRCLSLVVEGHKPVALGVATLAGHYPTYWIRRRLQGVESDVRQGVDWIQGLWRHGLIRAADAEVLESATAVGNLAWALSELAETTERRLATRFQAGVQVLFPLAVVMLGAVVFLMAVAYFLPLVQLIERLTDL